MILSTISREIDYFIQIPHEMSPPFARSMKISLNEFLHNEMVKRRIKNTTQVNSQIWNIISQALMVQHDHERQIR